MTRPTRRLRVVSRLPLPRGLEPRPSGSVSRMHTTVTATDHAGYATVGYG